MRDVLRELRSSHFTKWRALGTELGIRVGKLDGIEADSSKNDDRLASVIHEWLKRNYPDDEHYPPTWSNLASAIEPTDKALARQIREKHGKKYTPTHITE